MKKPILLPTITLAALALAMVTLAANAADNESASARFFKNAEKGGLELKSTGPIAFGPSGLLLISDPRSASIAGVDTADTGPVVKLGKQVDNVDAQLEKLYGAEPKGVVINDMAVNPASGAIYFSLNVQPGNKPEIARLTPAGALEKVDLSGMPYVRITLPSAENSKLNNVTDIAFADFSVIVAGQSNEEFANKIYQLPIPLEHGENARFFSAETYHVSHKKWETKAPIQSFIPYESEGEFYIVGAFACTPIAKFPLNGLESGAKIKGISVVELGGGNRPRDMFTYKRDGKEWLVTNTKRFSKNQFGPSAYWAARVDMDYLDASAPEETNENAPRRNTKVTSGPDAKGIEVVEALSGAVAVSQLENDEVVVLREDGEHHNVELLRLP